MIFFAEEAPKKTDPGACTKKLRETSTLELVEELKKRTGVQYKFIGPEENAEASIEGPAVLLIVQD